MPPVEIRQCVLTRLIEGIKGKIVRSKGDRTLAAIKCSRKRVVTLDLQTLRHATIELQHESVVLREHIAADFGDLCKGRVRPRPQERGYDPNGPAKRSVRHSQTSERSRRIEISIHKIWQILAIAE